MGSRYSVIQYVPDPVANERINIGAIAFDDKAVAVRFLQNWGRVKHFGDLTDLAWLQDFSKRMQVAAERGCLYPGDESDGRSNYERLNELVRGWNNSLQFSDIRGAILEPEALLDSIEQHYLVNPEVVAPKVRNRQAAARVVQRGVRQFLQRRYEQEVVQELMKRDYSLAGNFKPEHQFDVAVANGRPYAAAHAISFEVHPPGQLQDAIAFMIGEVRATHKDLPLAIVALPPTAQSRDANRLGAIYEQMITTYAKLGADVVSETDVAPWLDENLDSLVV